MIVDFSTLDLNARQAYILKNLDGTTIQPLLNVIDPHAKLSFNEVSELTFTVPSKIDGVATPHYADIVGMRIIDWDGVGQFILNNPKRTNDGVIELKQCTAYSLEYELGYKRVYIADGTYNLAEVLDMIFENVPSWGRGNLSVKALTRYRTFGGETYNVYDLLKGTLQDLYSCVFEFDTYERLIHVIDANDVIEQRPILISLNNLAKEIVVEENTEELFTCFSVTGADDVDISSVNPLGNNLIYNLDYFMNPSHFSQDFINKWNNWKDAVEANQQAFYMLTIDESLELVRRTTEEAKLLALRAEHSNLETEQTAYTSTGNATKESELYGEYQELLEKTEEKAAEIAQQEKLIESIQTTIDDLFQQKEDIVAACKFDQFFTTEEALLLDKYIRTSDFNEPSFVYREYTTYDTDDISSTATDVRIDVSEASITRITDNSGKELYRIVPGVSATSDSSGTITALIREIIGHSTAGTAIVADTRTALVAADIKNCVLEKKTDSSVVFTAELGSGTYRITNPDNTYEETAFASGCLSFLSDRVAILDSDLEFDEEVNAQYETGTKLAVLTSAATVYFTQGVTEYSKRSVEWELYEFAAAELEKAAWPKYQFTVDSANFLSAKEFEVFRKQFKLGTRIYLDLDGGLTPIAIGAEIDLDDPTSLSLTFGDEYSALDSAFQLVDILDQSVSMGKSYSANKGAYSNFISSGSKDALYSFINAPLDVAKNTIISSSDQAIQFDSAGLRLRKYADASMTTYDPKQIWMCHNSIVFTRDNWSSAETALGYIYTGDEYGWMYGLSTRALLGEMVLTNYLRVRSEKAHGGVAEFQVDGAGARLLNSKFTLANEYDTGVRDAIVLDPSLGIVAGSSSAAIPMLNWNDGHTLYGVTTEDGDVIQSIDDLDSGDEPNANFWVDMNGDVYIRGTVMAESGKFSGVVQASDFLNNAGESMMVGGKFSAEYLDLSGVEGAISDVSSEFKLTTAEILLRVEANTEYIDTKVSDLEAADDDIIDDLETMGIELGGRITATEENYSELKVYAEGIEGTVTEKITAYVDQQDDAIEKNIEAVKDSVADVQVHADKITATVRTDLTNYVNGKITNIESSMSTLEQTATNITGKVENLETDMSTTLSLREDGVVISNQDGDAVIISGSQIDATTINASQINASALNLDGTLSFSSFSKQGVAELNSRYQSQFSVDGVTGWDSTMDDSDMYRRDSYDGGANWGKAYLFRGKNGENGEPGSDAKVNWKNVKAALETVRGISFTEVTKNEVYTPNIYGGNIYGGNIYAGDGVSKYYAQMNDDGFTIWQEADVKARMYVTEDGNEVGVDLGRGSITSGGWAGAGVFHLCKKHTDSGDYARIIYNTNANEEIGFEFDDSGAITVYGDINLTGDATNVAVFG